MRAGHSFLSGVRVVLSCFPISESQRAVESRTIASGPNSFAYGPATNTAIYAAIRGAAFAAVGGAHRVAELPFVILSEAKDLLSFHYTEQQVLRFAQDDNSRNEILLRGARFVLVSPTEAPSYDALHDQMVGGVGHIHAYAEIEFPTGREIEVDGGKDLLRLMGNGVEL